jgi:RNA polymerase sigma-70 factor, ECF subfamily
VDEDGAVQSMERSRMGGAAVVAPAWDDDRYLVAALRAGDEAAFAHLLDRYHGALVRLAMAYVGDRSTAEEVAQDAWLGVMRGIDRFEERSSFRTWLFTILVNQARRRGERERRCVPFSALARGDGAEPAVAPDRFLPPGDESAGWWAAYPTPWSDTPEDVLVSGEVRAELARAIEALPAVQRRVVVLRDVEGWSAGEVCALLGLSEGNQRVILHRGRARLRRALERYLEGS